MSEHSSSLKSSQKDGFFGKRGSDRSPTRERGKSKGQRTSSALTNPQNNSRMSLPSTGAKTREHSKTRSSHSVAESYDEHDCTVSKSLTDLTDLPLPGAKQKKVSTGWDDDGFDDWNLDEVDQQQDKPATNNIFKKEPRASPANKKGSATFDFPEPVAKARPAFKK